MASKPSKITPTSTTVKPGPNLQPLNTPTAQQKLGVKPIKPIPIPKPVHSSVAHASVTDVTRLISASPSPRKMFFEEVARRCYEVANQEEEEEDKSVPRRPTTLSVKPQNTSQKDENEEEIPQTSATSAGSTYTMTVSSNHGEATTTTTTTKTTPLPENVNTSGKTMRDKIGTRSTKPNNYFICHQ